MWNLDNMLYMLPDLYLDIYANQYIVHWYYWQLLINYAVLKVAFNICSFDIKTEDM